MSDIIVNAIEDVVKVHAQEDVEGVDVTNLITIIEKIVKEGYQIKTGSLTIDQTDTSQEVVHGCGVVPDYIFYYLDGSEYHPSSSSSYSTLYHSLFCFFDKAEQTQRVAYFNTQRFGYYPSTSATTRSFRNVDNAACTSYTEDSTSTIADYYRLTNIDENSFWTPGRTYRGRQYSWIAIYKPSEE